MAASGTKSSAAPPASELSHTPPSEEEIRSLAYALYLQRRGTPGRPIDDWLEAERQLQARLSPQS
jgi:hypothetical protein